MSQMGAFNRVYEELEAKVTPEPFKPCGWYNKDGDSFEIYLSQEPHLTERVNSLISVYVDPKDRSKVLGFVIKNIKRHFGEAGFSQVTWFVNKATVRLILLSALTAYEMTFVRKGVHPEDSVKLGNRRIAALIDELGDAEVDVPNARELTGAGK